ncbi:MAG: SDR family NAD(P)-dependent oxidoreductase [Gammaproteobacteria bacterium]
MGTLTGRCAVITGAATGIGAATARRLARDGAAVLVADINDAGAARTVEAIVAAGGRAAALHVDVAEEAMIVAMIETAARLYGGIDILFNNAAALGPDEIQKDGPLTEQDAARWDRTMAVNLRGPMLACKYAIPRMIERGGGVIINTSSPAAVLAEINHCAYGASKAGLWQLTKHVATRYGRHGIRCNAIAPGAVIGENTRASLPPGYLERRARHTPAPRLGVPEDVASMVAFLVSDEAAYVNGIMVPVDGALLAHQPNFADEMDALERRS